MLSPFPGMDPYLERPYQWKAFHHTLINSIRDQLANAVSPHFFVDIEERVYVIIPETNAKPSSFEPDVFVVDKRSEPTASLSSEMVTTPTLVAPMYAEEVRDRYLEIRDSQNREVIATIEILSPFNKASGSRGRREFLHKREQVMASVTHWVEIDLLRAGKRSPEIAKQSDYYALLKRGQSAHPFEVWFFDVRDELPIIAVPLRPPFADVPLNLQKAFNDTYTRAHYADDIDYTSAPPLPRLRPADTNWARECARLWLQKRTEQT